MANLDDLNIYAILPLVDMQTAMPVHLGPVTFCAASMLGGDAPVKQGTCVLVSEDVPSSEWHSLFLDAVCLLYFATIFPRLYVEGRALPFDSFTTYLLMSSSGAVRAECGTPFVVEHVDPEIAGGLGQALDLVYGDSPITADADPALVRSLIRAIRYFVDRFITRFEDLAVPEEEVPSGCSQAEDIVFLVTACEALHHLGTQHPHIDFKHQLRPLLKIRHGTPVELFWKWVDGFFSLRHDLVWGKVLPDPVFRANPNFEIPYAYLGVKLFLYSVYHTMHDMELVPKYSRGKSDEPLDFRWVHPEEILVYFWPETALLIRIWKLMHAIEKQPDREELRSDLNFLSKTFVYFVEHYYKPNEGPRPSAVVAHPTPFEEISEPILQVLQVLETPDLGARRRINIGAIVHPQFISALRQRLHPTRE